MAKTRIFVKNDCIFSGNVVTAGMAGLARESPAKNSESIVIPPPNCVVHALAVKLFWTVVVGSLE